MESKPQKEIYVSTDIEADGPIPGPHSMISLASAAYLADKTLVNTFSANLELLPGTTGHPDTMKWWSEHPNEWQRCRSNPRPPKEVMDKYVKWLKSLPGIPVFVAYPATYDFMFVHWYLMRFVGDSPFEYHGLDIKTYAMAMLKKDFKQCSRKNFPKRWFDPHLQHTHVALDDAIEQGALFCNMLAENLGHASEKKSQ